MPLRRTPIPDHQACQTKGTPYTICTRQYPKEVNPSFLPLRKPKLEIPDFDLNEDKSMEDLPNINELEREDSTQLTYNPKEVHPSRKGMQDSPCQSPKKTAFKRKRNKNKRPLTKRRTQSDPLVLNSNPTANIFNSLKLFQQEKEILKVAAQKQKKDKKD